MLPFNSSSTASIRRVQVEQDGGIIAMGSFKDTLWLADDTVTGPLSESTYFITSISATGVMQWLRPIRSTLEVNVWDLDLGPQGDIYAQGRFRTDVQLPGAVLEASSSRNTFFARFDPEDGQCVAAYHFGPSLRGAGSLEPTAHGLYVSGEFDSTLVVGTYTVEASQYGATDYVLMKFDSLSGFTGIQPMPLQEGDLHIYANPNLGTCTIDLPTTMRLTDDLMLTIVGPTGQVVQRVPLRYSADGIAIDIQAQAKGVYHVELGDGRQRYTGKIVFE